MSIAPAGNAFLNPIAACKFFPFSIQPFLWRHSNLKENHNIQNLRKQNFDFLYGYCLFIFSHFFTFVPYFHKESELALCARIYVLTT